MLRSKVWIVTEHFYSEKTKVANIFLELQIIYYKEY